MNPISGKNIKLSLRGCSPELPAELQRIYPEVWRRLCALAEKTHVRIDLASGTVRHRGRSNRWKPLPSPTEGERLLETLKTVASLPKRSLDPKARMATIILAGGTGSRFGDGKTQKVLHPVGGVPSIDRLIGRCRAAGCDAFVVVVGWRWQEVVEHLEAVHPDLHYVCQPHPLGTGDAARYGARYLASKGFEGDILLLAGDKVLSADAIDTILKAHRERNADMTLSAASKSAWPGSGRVVLDGDDRVLAIVEQPDIARDRILELVDHWSEPEVDAGTLLAEARAIQPSDKKLKRGLGDDVWSLLHDRASIDLEVLRECLRDVPRGFVVRHADGGEQRMTGTELESRCDLVNVSLYAFRSGPLHDTLERIEPRNAQGEYYLTDAAQLLAKDGASGRDTLVIACRLPDDYDAAGFNTLGELAAIEARLA